MLYSLLTALIPENCWEKCIMRATVSCCLYVEEQILGRTKQKTSSNICAQVFGHAFKFKMAVKEVKRLYVTGDVLTLPFTREKMETLGSLSASSFSLFISSRSSVVS